MEVDRRPEVGATNHVVFVHGWLGSELASREDPSDVWWGDNAMTCLRTLALRSDALKQVEDPRLLVPGQLTKNYREFVRGLRLYGYFDNNQTNLSSYVYDGDSAGVTRLVNDPELRRTCRGAIGV